MSFTIVKDWCVGVHAPAFELNIRAVISTRSELQDLIEKLTRRLETDFAQEETQLVRNEPLHSPDAPWIDDGFTKSFRGD